MKSLLALFLSAVALSAANPASNMKLVFSDEFDAPALDASKWVTVGEPTAITPFKSGKVSGVRISLIKKEDMIQTNGISTRGKFEQVRGYFEASIRMNGYRGHGGSMSLRGKDDKVVPLGVRGRCRLRVGGGPANERGEGDRGADQSLHVGWIAVSVRSQWE